MCLSIDPLPDTLPPTQLRFYWEPHGFTFGPGKFTPFEKRLPQWGRWVSELEYEDLTEEEGYVLDAFYQKHNRFSNRAILVPHFAKLLPKGIARDSHNGKIAALPLQNSHTITTKWDVSVLDTLLFKAGDLIKMDLTGEVYMVEDDVVVGNDPGTGAGDGDHENVVVTFPQYVRTVPAVDDDILVESVTVKMQLESDVQFNITAPSIWDGPIRLVEDFSLA